MRRDECADDELSGHREINHSLNIDVLSRTRINSENDVQVASELYPNSLQYKWSKTISESRAEPSIALFVCHWQHPFPDIVEHSRLGLRHLSLPARLVEAIPFPLFLSRRAEDK